ncbi:rhodanese-like domain-containing protein [Clostridium sp. MCC353]|uniref:rhodanese-like domain-containing protein n=1 Tax=Clostridium sp. MCC353 TaxID=2592646 RepID=UPI001C01006B|nr:rhodanese-like domain-containing protein [Clostridium sp. MCC353]MBT9775871.1 rhodanese-like domain-containing protein [Clostridium sp. MCC353]
MSFPTITLDELEYYLDQGRDMTVVDLRNRASYQMGHIKGAVNIPFNEIDYNLDRLPRDKMLVLYCSRGGQSLRASRYLSTMGYQPVNVANGITYYRGKYLERM